MFRVDCDVLEQGCFDPISWQSLFGRVVWDRRRSKFLTWIGRWLYVILRWSVVAALGIMVLKPLLFSVVRLRMLVLKMRIHGPRCLESTLRSCRSAAARNFLLLLFLALAWLLFVDAYTNDEVVFVEPNGSLAKLMAAGQAPVKLPRSFPLLGHWGLLKNDDP